MLQGRMKPLVVLRLLALPLLDSMLPAQTPLRRAAASPRPRLACIEMVHGAAGSTPDGAARHDAITFAATCRGHASTTCRARSCTGRFVARSSESASMIE